MLDVASRCLPVLLCRTEPIHRWHMSQLSSVDYAVTVQAARCSTRGEKEPLTTTDAVNVVVSMDIVDAVSIPTDAAEKPLRPLADAAPRRVTFEAGIPQFLQLLSVLEEAEAAMEAAAASD